MAFYTLLVGAGASVVRAAIMGVTRRAEKPGAVPPPLAFSSPAARTTEITNQSYASLSKTNPPTWNWNRLPLEGTVTGL